MIHIQKEMMQIAFVPTANIDSMNVYGWAPGSGSRSVSFSNTSTGNANQYEHVINGTSYGVKSGSGGVTTITLNVPSSFTFVARVFYNGTLLQSKTYSGNLTPY